MALASGEVTREVRVMPGGRRVLGHAERRTGHLAPCPVNPVPLTGPWPYARASQWPAAALTTARRDVA